MDIILFLVGLRAARVAQKVRSVPLPQVISELCGLHAMVTTSSPRRAARAATRASSRFARFSGGIDTCLTRALVAGALLADRERVVLHVGFRPGREATPVDGHAWLTVAGSRIELTNPPNRLDQPYTTARDFGFAERQGGPRGTD